MWKSIGSMFKDDKENVSSMRVMALLGCITACFVFIVLAFRGADAPDLTGVLITLFGLVYAGKATQKFIESKKD